MADFPVHKKKSKKGQDLKIHTIINSRYRIFDRSGRLPFSIVFGLCRRSPEDTDPRPLILQTANSVLDIPYALSQGLLQLRMFDEKTKQDVQVHIEHLIQQLNNNGESYLALPSPVGRTGSWKKALVTYQYHIDPSSELASLLEPGKTYRIQKGTGGDPSAEYAYANQAESSKEQLESSTLGKKRKLVFSSLHGRANFVVVPSLPWPPNVQTRMGWSRSKGDGRLLEVTVSSMGAEAITVQTSGRQRFCVPCGPMEEEEGHIMGDTRPRIIHTNPPAPAATLQVIDMATGTVVREARKPGFCLYQEHDPRPKLKQLITLKPDEPLVRQIDISILLSELSDGTYGLRMEPRGMWWCVGSCEDFACTGGEDRVPQNLYQSMIPPLMLECDDVAELQVENGVAVR
ncbi:Fc.00g055300.m01.CDS01 [Cosmosporella sp. VM-42]